MIKTSIIATAMMAVMLLTACAGESKKETGTATETTDAPDAATPTVIGELDPVCEMEREASWTEFSVYKADTIWFCGEGCKQAFDARPEKYMGTKG